MKNLLFVFAITLLSLDPVMAHNEDPVVYDYVSIVATGSRILNVRISIGGAEHTEITVKGERRTHFDFRQLFEIINEFEKQGYELYTNNFDTSGDYFRNYFLLRKPKNQPLK